ncbi:hypothetical protein [uncultured Maribacter sp.]|uniref:phenylacetate--CoA ligase family protein n=1 Tax=uncultured Maribacter sp. TaxID=431308 RepID=UPI002606F131|nr:hypothetical protein [uncultured Maribacter sp.]
MQVTPPENVLTARGSFSKLIFLLKTKILRPNLNRLHRKTNDALKNQNISSINIKKRNAIFQHAKEHSDFYKKKYAKLKINITGNLTPEDFLKIPPLTREEIRNNFDAIKANNVSQSYCDKVSTSGSTSLPISVIHDNRNPETPIRWRILSWWGINPWENQAFIYRFKKSFFKQILNTILWWPTKRIFLAAANPQKKQLEKYVRDFNRIKPTLLQGYVDVVFEFALYLLDNNIKIYAPKMVWVTSAPLFEEQRILMEKAFGAPVCDQYGNTEIMLIASECPNKEGLHIMQDTVHIEFVDEFNQPVPPNTTGKILLTDLTNYAFPLIRYEIGDEGQYKELNCTCGIPLPLMNNVHGRQSTHIVTPSGLHIKGEHIMAMFNEHMGMFKELQLIQQTDFSVSINFVPRIKDGCKISAEKMVDLLKKRSRSEIKIRYTKTHKICQVGNKTPLIISNVTSNI